MSLLDEYFEDFRIMNKAVVDDGYGGRETQWTEGATVKGAMVYEGSELNRIAEAVGSTTNYRFTCRRDLELDFHDVLKRVNNPKYFRITTNSDENQTPKSAGINMRQYFAEELAELPR